MDNQQPEPVSRATDQSYTRKMRLFNDAFRDAVQTRAPACNTLLRSMDSPYRIRREPDTGMYIMYRLQQPGGGRGGRARGRGGRARGRGGRGQDRGNFGGHPIHHDGADPANQIQNEDNGGHANQIQDAEAGPANQFQDVAANEIHEEEDSVSANEIPINREEDDNAVNQLQNVNAGADAANQFDNENAVDGDLPFGFDRVMSFDNSYMKQMIKDPSDLVARRRRMTLVGRLLAGLAPPPLPPGDQQGTSNVTQNENLSADDYGAIQTLVGGLPRPPPPPCGGQPNRTDVTANANRASASSSHAQAQVGGLPRPLPPPHGGQQQRTNVTANLKESSSSHVQAQAQYIVCPFLGCDATVDAYSMQPHFTRDHWMTPVRFETNGQKNCYLDLSNAKVVPSVLLLGECHFLVHFEEVEDGYFGCLYLLLGGSSEKYTYTISATESDSGAEVGSGAEADSGAEAGSGAEVDSGRKRKSCWTGLVRPISEFELPKKSRDGFFIRRNHASLFCPSGKDLLLLLVSISEWPGVCGGEGYPAAVVD